MSVESLAGFRQPAVTSSCGRKASLNGNDELLHKTRERCHGDLLCLQDTGWNAVNVIRRNETISKQDEIIF